MIARCPCRAVLTRILAGGMLLLVAGLGSPLRAQANPGWKLPIEFLQGFASSEGLPVRPYLASIAIIPGYATPSVRAGLRVSADYENPDWTFRLRPRVEVPVVPMRANIGLILGAEGTTNFDGDLRAGAGLTFDVDGLIRAGVWAGWDEVRDGGWFGITLGADPTSWFGCVESSINPDRC